MPIVEQPLREAPLNQGDILDSVRLYFTSAGEGTPKLVGDDQRLVLVVSRECTAQHKSKVVVVRVARYQDNLPKRSMEFDDVLGFLQDLRDGQASPDTFYLGQLPGKEGRFCAKLDSMYTLELPTPEQRATWLAAVRIASLALDFRRDLQVRLFGAFARSGFEDDQWYSDEDLDWVVSAAQQAVRAQEAKVAACETDVSKFKASGAADRVSQVEVDLQQARKRLDELNKIAGPFNEERKRRTDGRATPPEPPGRRVGA